MADEARNLKQYKELPENSKSSLVSDTNLYQWLMRFCAAVRVNETDTFADEEGLNDEYFDFEDISGKFLCYKLPAGRLCCPLLTYAYSLHFCICRDLGEASSSHSAVILHLAYGLQPCVPLPRYVTVPLLQFCVIISFSAQIQLRKLIAVLLKAMLKTVLPL